jgi:hypothetical protein
MYIHAQVDFAESLRDELRLVEALRLMIKQRNALLAAHHLALDRLDSVRLSAPSRFFINIILNPDNPDNRHL